FLAALPNFPLVVNSCHLFLPFSSSLVALIFLNLGRGFSSSFSAAALAACACGYISAAADRTMPLLAEVGVSDDGLAVAVPPVLLDAVIPSALRFCATGRISLARSVSAVS